MKVTVIVPRKYREKFEHVISHLAYSISSIERGSLIIVDVEAPPSAQPFISALAAALTRDFIVNGHKVPGAWVKLADIARELGIKKKKAVKLFHYFCNVKGFEAGDFKFGNTFYLPRSIAKEFERWVQHVHDAEGG